MSWTDLKSIEQIKKLRDEFSIKTFIETGTFKGINALVQSYNFEEVLTCEIMGAYVESALRKLEKKRNVILYKSSSPKFLERFVKSYKQTQIKDIVFIYLDAHFYDPTLEPKDRFVVLKELKSLKGFKNCIICIHDFDNGLGHITYDGIKLDFDLLKKDLFKVNPNFKFYTNTKEGCNILDKESIKETILKDDEDALDNLDYVWSNPEKTYRGILYCVPKELDLTKYELVKYGIKS